MTTYTEKAKQRENQVLNRHLRHLDEMEMEEGEGKCPWGGRSEECQWCPSRNNCKE